MLDHRRIKLMSKKRRLTQPFLADVSICLAHFLQMLAFLNCFGTFFHATWNTFWLKDDTQLKIGQKTSQKIRTKVIKIQGCSSCIKNLRTKNRRRAVSDPLSYQIGLRKQYQQKKCTKLSLFNPEFILFIVKIKL